MNSAEIKKMTGSFAVDTLVKSGMKLGMGTGSTAIEALLRLKDLLQSGKLENVYLVPTSLQTEIACRDNSLTVWSLNDPVIDGKLDLTIDGADEVDPQWCLIKGGGGAQLVEKIIAAYSSHYAIIIDESKIVTRLGEKYPVPVEVLLPALLPVTRQLEKLGARISLRQAVRQAGPVITKHGNLILDSYFERNFDPHAMEQAINAIPGVVENGIFNLKVTDLFVGKSDGTVDHQCR